MQAMVPQFIDVEDKITPFLTMKQFFMFVVAGAICAMLYPFLETTPWMVISAGIIGVSAAFGFIKINGRSFSTILFAWFKFIWNPHLYIYQRGATVQKKEIKQVIEEKKPIQERTSEERLQQIAHLLDARGNNK